MTKRALILGLGISGKSVAPFLEKRGYRVTGVDDALAPLTVEDITAFDLFVPSPGVPPTHPLYVAAKEKGVPIKGDVELALEEFRGIAIGITGTNGKTTTVQMLEHSLPGARAVGNVGIPITKVLDEGSAPIFAVELSSFQLETMTRPSLDFGVVLNIEEDHLNRYASMSEYALAKGRIVQCLKKGGALFVEKKTLARYKGLFPKEAIPIKGEAEEVTHLIGERLQIPKAQMEAAISSFVKGAHRLEFVSRVDSVDCYNDSKATNVAAVLWGIDRIPGPLVLILGGLDKGLTFAPLLEKKQRLLQVIAYGSAGEKIASELAPFLPFERVKTLEEATARALEKGKEGATVLFSPGCASFDAFANYAERGDAFKRYVTQRSHT